MKIFTLFFVFFFIQIGYCQKKYHLDYALEFDVKIDNRKIKKNIIYKDVDVLFYMVNSQANNTILNVFKNDEKNYKLLFNDKNGLIVNSLSEKDAFHKAETINNSCDGVHKISNPYKYQVNNYDFINLKDTIINDISYFHYCIKTNRGYKYQKRKKIVTIHYIVDKNSPNFLPFLLEHTCYEEWKKERNIPNGIPFIIFHKNYKNEINYKIQLKNAVKIDRFFTIPNECDFTKI